MWKLKWILLGLLMSKKWFKEILNWTWTSITRFYIKSEHCATYKILPREDIEKTKLFHIWVIVCEQLFGNVSLGEVSLLMKHGRLAGRI